MGFKRDHGDLLVEITRSRDDNTIMAVTLEQPGNHVDGTPWTDQINLTAEQAYALTDDVAIADPDTWAKRDPQQHYAELALRRVADYFKNRAEEIRRDLNQFKFGLAAERFQAQADTFEVAMTRVLEEIEALYDGSVPDRDTANLKELLYDAAARRS